MVKILLADVVYERVATSPLVVPAAIGGIMAYAKANSTNDLDIKIVQTIEQYNDAISTSHFDIVWFSYYCWNARLSNILAKKIKSAQPDSIVIFGGPNLPIDPKLKEEIVRTHSHVDFFIEKEGEVAFTNCVDALILHKFDVSAVKELRLASVRSVLDNSFLTSSLEQRLKDLDCIPSPYLNGSMEEFLDAGFVPIMETNRGCPFSCAFCGEGDKYYSLVARKSLERVSSEIKYLAQKMHSLKNLAFSKYLYFSDSNTGMYRQDSDLADCLVEAQNKFDWPRLIAASTGKNSKERIIDFSSKLDGALTLTASVQSTDPEVLKNIKRDNVSVKVLMDVATRSDSEHDTYSEIILGLPGDTYSKHINSIKEMMDSRISQLSIVQLMLLADTPMLSPSYIEQYGMEIRYRMLVKGATQIEVAGKNVTVAEIEAICIGNTNMPYSDYIKARIFDFYVTLFYNKIFSARSFDWLQNAKKSAFDYINTVVELDKPDEFSDLIDEYVRDIENELYKDPAEIEALLEQEGTYKKIKNHEIGHNITQHYVQKSSEMIELLTEIALNAVEKVGGATFREILFNDIQDNVNWEFGGGLVNQRMVKASDSNPNYYPGAIPR